MLIWSMVSTSTLLFLSKASMTGMCIDDIFLLILVLLRNCCCMCWMCVGCSMCWICVGFHKCYKIKIISNIHKCRTHKRIWCKILSKVIQVDYVVWIYGLVELKNLLALLRNIIFSKQLLHQRLSSWLHREMFFLFYFL